MKSFALNGARFFKNIISLSLGYLIYKVTKVTPKHAYLSMRQLFCQTNGKSNNFIAKVENSMRTKYELNQVDGILGTLSPKDVIGISNSIKENGYYIFPEKLEKGLIDEMLRFARSTPSIPRMTNDKTPLLYDSLYPVSPIYDFTTQSLFENPILQSILLDQSVLAVAQEYLGPRPLLDLVVMWWSTANCENADLSKGAQLYHFDLDRIKFLKFFIYLSDVDTNNGPHCYIKQSHKIKPRALRKDGRIMDDEIKQYYPAEHFKEIIGEIGTILAVDTSGFHKGKPLGQGERLLFQMEFATSLFGQMYPSVKLNDENKREFLFKTEYKDTYSRILE